MSQVANPPMSVNPAATGGAGPFFEQHVDAAFLSLLLVRGIPPCLPSCELVEVHFQTTHKGWHTDDLLLVGRKSDGQAVRLAAQIKRTFVVSRQNEDFQKTIADAWQDFLGLNPFNPETDCFAIIVLRGTESLLNHFTTLLDRARFSLDAADFAHRLATPGMLNKKARQYYDEVLAVVEQATGRPPAANDVFEFLKHLHVLSFDLNSSTAQTEAWIKTLMAYTANGPDRIAASGVSWNEMVALAGAAEPHAASFTYDDLPAPARHRHARVGALDYHAVTTLQQHSSPIERSALSKIGGTFHLPRHGLLTDILTALDTSRVVIVTGVAGSGKSALAGEIFENMKREMPAFAFRAEEFSRPHLDETLHAAHVQLNAYQLSALLALQPRKLFWIESLERLLEKAERAAFADLLQLVREDPSCRLVLTCRDYSVDLVRSSFLERAALEHEVVTVPLLSDAELQQMLDVFPQLTGIGRKPNIRELLRNPYILDKASRMQWREGATLPENERSFRAKVWHEIVREDENPQDSMPHRRAAVFLEVALRRARALSPYANCSDLDRAVLDRLRQSGLVEFAQMSDNLVAPAHDVLEDWALLEWLDEQFAHGRPDPDAFLLEAGTHPALRRTYRKWLEEMLECAPQDADQLVASVLASTKLPQQTRDDTLVAVLLSKKSQSFLERNEAQLLAENCSLLRRVIHLLRVGCKSSVGNRQLEQAAPLIQWIHFLPKYPAWAAVLKIVRKNLDTLARRKGEFIVGLLEDWGQGVSGLLHYPLGAEDAAHIAFSLLPKTDDWRHWDRESRKRLLKVIVKIPKGAPDEIKDLAKRASNHGRDDRIAHEFAELVLEHLDGTPMCRDFPDEVIQMAAARWGIVKMGDEAERSGFRDHFEVEVAFGLWERMCFDFFPPSAFHGPFWALLVHHPDVGVEFVLRLMNYCADCYGDPKTFHRSIELPEKTFFILPDGRRKEQWCNWRLWGLYRGATVGPKVVECALMALERWLLDVCRKDPEEAEAWLVHLLNQSNNVAITAVVASVAIAHPHLAGIAGPALLTSPQFIEMDRARMSHDFHPIGQLFEEMPQFDVEHAFFKKERSDADAFEHRRSDLEYLAIQLQTGHQRNRIAEILDNYRRELPPLEQQSEGDKLWRLALLRMDLRDYEAKGRTEDGRELIGPKQPEPEVQAVIDAHTPRQTAFTQRMALVTWAMGIFRNETTPKADPFQWRERLKEAQQTHESLEASNDTADTVDWRMAVAGLTYAAAVFIRDHWTELTAQERVWTARVIIESISRDADSENYLFVCGRNSMDASRPAAFVVSALFNRGLGREREGQLLEALSLALTHASEEVRDYAAEGIGTFLWKANQDLALTCAGAFVKAAEFEELAEEQQRLKPFAERANANSICDQARIVARKAILAREPFDEGGLFRLDLDDWPGQRAMHYLLPIFTRRGEDAVAKNYFVKVSESLAAWWRKGRERPHQLEYLCQQRLANFVLQLTVEEAVKICDPLIRAAADFPKEAGEFIKQLIIREDAVGSGPVFWTLWQKFADHARQAPWIDSLDERHQDENSLIGALFLAVPWNEGVRHWQRLAGNEVRLNRLFEASPPTAPMLAAYCRYLFKLGEKSLPDTLILVSNKLRQIRPNSSILSSDAQVYLESLLRRWVLSQPGRLKENAVLRDAVVHILDELVEVGSATAYRLRDDFVTPFQTITNGNVERRS